MKRFSRAFFGLAFVAVAWIATGQPFSTPAGWRFTLQFSRIIVKRNILPFFRLHLCRLPNRFGQRLTIVFEINRRWDFPLARNCRVILQSWLLRKFARWHRPGTAIIFLHEGKPEFRRMPVMTAGRVERGWRFIQSVVREGLEGIMAKGLDTPYLVDRKVASQGRAC